MAREFQFYIVPTPIGNLGDITLRAIEILKNVDNNVRSGSIILMHDYVSRRSHTIEALKKMIPLLLDKGYEFVTVSELMGK